MHCRTPGEHFIAFLREAIQGRLQSCNGAPPKGAEIEHAGADKTVAHHV